MDEKKGKKDDKKGSAGKTAEEILITIFVAFLALVFVAQTSNFFFSNNGGSGISNTQFEMLTGGPNGWFANLLHFIQVSVSIYIMIATIFCIVTFLAILWVAWLTHELKVEEKKKSKIVAVEEKLPSMQNQKWRQIQTHVNSQNPAEWRLSILEADVLLDDLVQSLGYMGETLGDRLKNAAKGDFKTLDAAWEGHKIRNAIAHEGSNFVLSQRESKRVIGLYEMVFNEFNYV